jgi:Family of unknown function (DUF6492)
MDDLAVLTPCYRGDASLFGDLHRSVLANTEPSVVHHVAVPPSDVHVFREYESARCQVWTHRDLLPRHCLPVPNSSGLMLNLRRPWPPTRGWIVQQIMKLAGAAVIDARAVLIVDSDAFLVREATLDQFMDDGRLLHHRRAGAVTADMKRHVLWHNVARKLLGVGGIASAPLPDYVSPIAVWDPAVVRSLTTHIADTTRRHWVDAFGGQLHISEFVLYGVFVDHVVGGVQPRGGDLCHNYYDRARLSPAEAAVFADRMPSDALGAMITSHSETPRDVRMTAFRRCRQLSESLTSKASLFVGPMLPALEVYPY